MLVMPTAAVSRSALHLVLFGMPDAGKSSLLGALLQSAQVQSNVLHGQLTDGSGGLAELQRRVYEHQPKQTLEEIAPFPATFVPQTETDEPGRAVDVALIDCDGRTANEILARPQPDTARGALADAVRQADALILVVDAAAAAAQTSADFTQCARFVRLLERGRGQRSEVSGLPVFLVLTKCDLLAQANDSLVDWLDRIEQRKNQVGTLFKEFLERAGVGAPFGRIDLHLWATAVSRPALVDAAAKPDEPYGVAELFRQAFDAAVDYRGRSQQSTRRLAVTVGASVLIITLLSAGAVTLFLTSERGEPGPFERQVDAVRAREMDLGPLARHRDVPAKIDELKGFIDQPGFVDLPPRKQEELRLRLRELQAYQQYEKQLLQLTDPRDLRTVGQLQELESHLQDIKVPTEYRVEWSQTESGRRQSEYQDDVRALSVAAGKAEEWYRGLIKDGRQVLDNSGGPNLPARAKKVLDESKNAPFAENELDKVLPGGHRVTYGTLFSFGGVAELRRLWDNDIKKKLEPAAKLSPP
jgi:GTPase SAR1 family protein